MVDHLVALATSVPELDPCLVELLAAVRLEPLDGRLRRPVRRREELPVLLAGRECQRSSRAPRTRARTSRPGARSRAPRSPHANGLPAPGAGGGMNGAIILKMSCMPVLGCQQASASRPPGFVTRASSPAIASWSGANMTPQVESTTSKLASSNDMSSASPTWKSTSAPSSAARSRAVSMRTGAMSCPTTSAPRFAARIATAPVPVAASSTRSPGFGSVRSSASAWMSRMVFVIRS